MCEILREEIYTDSPSPVTQNKNKVVPNKAQKQGSNKP